MNTDRDKKIHEHVLEQYLLGELPVDRVMDIEKRLQADRGLREKIDSLKKSNIDILKKYFPGSVVPEIMNRYESEVRRTKKVSRAKPLFLRRLLYASPAFALVLILILFVFPIHKKDVGPVSSINVAESTRVKGTQGIDLSKPNLLIHRKTDDHIELLKNGARAKAGDLLQLAYTVPGEFYGVIFSIDGRGVVTLHFPEEKSESTALKQDKKILLPHAYELDNAPGFERFFFITSKSAVNTAKILEKAESLAKNPDRARVENIEVDETLNQYSILIEKENKQ